MNKTVRGIFPSPAGHWVGDGFPVRSLFSYERLGQHISPFLLLDYAGPAEFSPAPTPRGVGEHPHRGFETVTIVYSGEVAHRDSMGNGGLIGPGDVQWMTAAGGILHEEFHSPAFTKSGGALEMVQLWVNLPAKHKMSTPRYQTLLNKEITNVELPGGAGSARVIAGSLFGHKGPASTFSPLNVWDLKLQAGRAVLPIPAGHVAALAVMSGEIRVNDSRAVGGVELVLLGTDGEEVVIEASRPSAALLLSGEPIREPIVGHGPFVMNSSQEIEAAIQDYRVGKFGRMRAIGA